MAVPSRVIGDHLAENICILGLLAGAGEVLADAVRYEAANDRPGLARNYWDAFGAGMMLAVGLIVVGGLWSLFAGMRERRAQVVEESFTAEGRVWPAGTRHAARLPQEAGI